MVGEKSFDCCLDYFVRGEDREMELRTFGCDIFLSQNVSKVSDGCERLAYHRRADHCPILKCRLHHLMPEKGLQCLLHDCMSQHDGNKGKKSSTPVASDLGTSCPS